MSVISINLGLLNLLPIPILDGGHLMFFFIEKLRKKSIGAYAQGLVFQFGLWVIFILASYAFFNDLLRVFF